LTQAFIFDFDGTLVDSEQAIYKCFQSITKQLAPNRVEYAKSILIGPPLRDTASEILGREHHGLLDQFINLFIKIHDEQVIHHTNPYPNVNQILQILYEKKIPMALATNKRLAPTLKLIDHFEWTKYFLFIECSDSETHIRNKDEMIKSIINRNIFFNSSFFVGDTTNDGFYANLNNLPFIKAKYGYGKKQNWDEIKIFKCINNISGLIEEI